MSGLRTLSARLAAVCRRRRHEEALADQIGTHLELLAADYRRQGMSAEAAGVAARRDFGGIDQVKERYRDQRGLRVADVWMQGDEGARTSRQGREMSHQ